MGMFLMCLAKTTNHANKNNPVLWLSFSPSVAAPSDTPPGQATLRDDGLTSLAEGLLWRLAPWQSLAWRHGPGSIATHSLHSNSVCVSAGMCEHVHVLTNIFVCAFVRIKESVIICLDPSLHVRLSKPGANQGRLQDFPQCIKNALY